MQDIIHLQGLQLYAAFYFLLGAGSTILLNVLISDWLRNRHAGKQG